MESSFAPNRPRMAAGNIVMIAICLLAALVFWSSLEGAIRLALNDDRYLQIVLGPLACVFLLFWHKGHIFSQARYSPDIGIPILSLAVLLAACCRYMIPNSGTTGILGGTLGIVLIWLAAFVLRFGVRSFRAGVYPLGCLLLLIPVPPVWIDQVATGLQYGSAAVSHELIRLSGIPVWRHGMQFSIPGLDFEVAPECSGIRSSLTLMIVAVVAGYIYLRSAWSRSALVILTVPIVIFKNSVRIAGISILGAYVDPVFFSGPLHHSYGGLVFSVVGVILFVLALAAIQKVERWHAGLASRSHSAVRDLPFSVEA
jgi:exosortase